MLKKSFLAKFKEKLLEFIWDMSIKKRMTYLYFRLLFGYVCGNLKEYKKEIMYIAKHGISMFPYSFSEKYADYKCEVSFDNKEEKFFVLHKGKKLYFPGGMSREDVYRAYKQLLAEQETNSPHQYWSDLNRPKAGDVFIDVGAAEGIIALDLIDLVDKVILVECEERWRRALEATFAPYKNKAEILSAYCCEKAVGGGKITIDNIAAGIKRPVIKMDIEGAEIVALKGAEKTLRRKDVKWAICTYHRKDDAKNIEDIFVRVNKKYEYSDGYLLLPYDLEYEYPYFRKGVLRVRG